MGQEPGPSQLGKSDGVTRVSPLKTPLPSSQLYLGSSFRDLQYLHPPEWYCGTSQPQLSLLHAPPPG